MLTVCGVDCNTCPSFGTECKGCKAIKGKVFWVQYIGAETCPVYACVEKKGLQNCGQCAELPCQTWYNLKDPSYTDEQHLKSINDRVALLRKADK